VELAEKIGLGIVLIAFATTLVLPDRQTNKILQTSWAGFNQSLRTSMGR